MQIKINQPAQKKYKTFRELKHGALFKLAPNEKQIKGIPQEAAFLIKTMCDEDGNDALITHTGNTMVVDDDAAVIEFAITAVEEV